MHQQAQLRLKKDEVEKLGAETYVVIRWIRIEPESSKKRTGCSAATKDHSARKKASSSLRPCRTPPVARPRSTAFLAAPCGGGAGRKTIHTGLSSTEKESSRTF